MLQEILISTSLTIAAIAILGFLLSRILKRNDIADIIWGLGFLIIALVNVPELQTLTLKSKVVITFVALWSLRLATYLGIRTFQKTEDIRYANWRKDWQKREPYMAFFKVFTLQAFIMGIISLPLSIILKTNAAEITSLEFAATCLFIIGFLFESISDSQMYIFKKDPKNKGKVCNTGLWSLTRHPNYFGEILIWWGFFLFAINTASPLVALVSPLLLTFLIIKVSGVAMLEDVMKNKGEAYNNYVSSTPALFPFSNRKFLQFLAVVFVTIVLDYIWLGNLFNEFYVTQAMEVARITNNSFDVIMWAAAGVYVFIPLGIVYFALSNNTTSRLDALFKGSIYGLALYTVYDFTNIALVKSWPLEMALIDICWGPILCGLTAFICFRKND